MANIHIDISENGVTTLATAGKYCDRNIDVNTNVHDIEDALISGTYSGEYRNDRISTYSCNVVSQTMTGIVCRNAKFANVDYRQSVAMNKLQYYLFPANTVSTTYVGLCYNLRGALKIDIGSIPEIGYDYFRHNEACKAHIIRNKDAVPAPRIVTSGTSFSSMAQSFGYSPLLNNDASLGCFIYVPRNMVSAYQEDENWSAFSNCYRAIEDYPEICDMDNENWTPTRDTGVNE